MANPQLEDGYIRIANEIWQALRKIRIPGEAMQILMVILEETYGWNRKEAMIQNKTFVEKTGISKQHVNRAISKLTELNLVKVAQKGYSIAPTYCFNKDYATWKKVAQKGYSSPKRLQALPIMATPIIPEPFSDNGPEDPKDSIKDNTLISSSKKQKKKSPKVQKIFPPDSFEMDIVERFWNTQIHNYPPETYNYMRKSEKKFQKWAVEIEKLKRLDGKTEKVIYDVIDFALFDDFWSENLRSLSVIRKSNKEGISKFEMIEQKWRKT